MPLIGERLTDLKERPRISKEQHEALCVRELEIGKRIGTLAPPLGGYMIYPLFYTDDLTVTISGCATYQVGETTVAAFVTRDCNNEVRLQTMLYDDLADGAFVHHTTIDTTRKGVAVGVSRKQWNKGRLEYQHRGLNTGGLLTTFEQNVDALSNINETLDLVEAANIQTYGVANFEGLDRERLAAIRENAEPGLENFVDQSMKEYMEAHNV